MNNRELSQEVSRIYADYPHLDLSGAINLALLNNCTNPNESQFIEFGFMDFDGVIIRCTNCRYKTDTTSNGHYSSCTKCNKVFENNKG